MKPYIVSVAVPVPLRQSFDFLVPEGFPKPLQGTRVLVPFGRQQRVGVIIKVKHCSDYPVEKLKPIIDLLDVESILTKNYGKPYCGYLNITWRQ